MAHKKTIKENIIEDIDESEEILDNIHSDEISHYMYKNR